MAPKDAHSRRHVLGNVVKFLYRFGDADYAGIFMKMCGPNSHHIHATAIWLAGLGLPEAEKGLRKILRSTDDRRIQARAARALRRIRQAAPANPNVEKT